ncbi:11310_t:CDS:2 [Diversispora eburnea]|uniref:11310_t:CDS:1 n=1 Tax=Diversispora eburnea TaxID=1213867 RepID=A0A9N8WBL4_9GLOM|nr:11310_t:CDS:2 [Diversispora eburnea]
MSVIFPETVTDLDGRTVNVGELASRHVLVFITLKATWCPVCPQLLLILNLHGLQDDPPSEFRDPFDDSIMRVDPEKLPFYRLLLKTDAYFIIMCPKRHNQVRQIQKACNFTNLPYPFVVDEDLTLASSINLRMSENEMWPCIGYIQPETRVIRPISSGRGPTFYGHNHLLTFLRDYRTRAEKKAVENIIKANELFSLLKKLTENQQEQQESQESQIQQKKLLPVELLSQIFEYLDSIEISKTIMSICQHWRAIGLDVMTTRLRKEIKVISDSLVIHYVSITNEIKEVKEIKINPDKKMVSVRDLNERAERLYKMVEIIQPIVI